ncbi:MAG: hypothetical protein L0H73_10795 [Nitrococcus sp.]|nr:hypothetical protein [Nitrococcus sp.]
MSHIGLINDNEFYSEHYLAEIFTGDIRGVLETWQARESNAREAAKANGEAGAGYTGYRTPASRLAGLARELLQRIEGTERLRHGAERVRASRAVARRLLELSSRREAESFKAVSALLHRHSLLESQGQALLDTLDENAHKHAYGVSEDLKYALRECIERLGNEAAAQLEERARRQKKSIFSGDEALDPGELSLQCLRYMYRLLFLFYIEARPELRYAPVESETYLKGYSLEHLRELELMPLTSEAERGGRYFDDTLNMLFRLIQEGYRPNQDLLAEESRQSGRDAFEIHPLRSHLFDPARTSLLNKVVFPNHLLQRVIRLMSLSREGGSGARKRRGRISYAQLGINQLGAVYEALLSYRGFFAGTDLYEVKPKEESWDPLGTGYFVKAEALADRAD